MEKITNFLGLKAGFEKIFTLKSINKNKKFIFIESISI